MSYGERFQIYTILSFLYTNLTLDGSAMVYYRPSQFVSFWFLKKHGKILRSSEFGKLAYISLLEDPQTIDHRTSRGTCFNFIKFTILLICLTLELYSPTACALMSYYMFLGNCWWCRQWCTISKGLGQRAAQHENQALNPSKVIPHSEQTEHKETMQMTLMPCWVRAALLPDAGGFME